MTWPLTGYLEPTVILFYPGIIHDHDLRQLLSLATNSTKCHLGKKPTRDSPALVSAVKAFDKLAIETEDPVVALIKLTQSKRLGAVDLKDAKENKLNLICLLLPIAKQKI
jgi:hypothetical protein